MNTTEFPYKDVQEYLDVIGILETGTAQDIEKARKVFRKLYLQQYQKRRYQNTHVNVTISFSKKEKALVEKMALTSGKRLASYIKHIALSFTNSNIETPPPFNSVEIKRLLSLSYDIVEALAYENNYPELKSSYEELLELFEQLEKLFQ